MSAFDTVYLRGLTLETVIGVYDWEREIRQEVVLDLDVASDNRAAAATDSIEDAVDYKAMADALQARAASSSFELVESLAEDLAEMLIKDFGLAWVSLRLAKPGALPGNTVVGVSIERHRA